MTAKACRQCGEMKALSDFHAHKKMRDGHSNQCKVCVLARLKTHSQENPEIYQARAAMPRNKALRAEYRKSQEWRDKANAIKEKYRKSNLEKAAAHQAVLKAVRRGQLWKSPCCTAPGCFSTEKIQGHHTHYDNKLSVVWLCEQCHRNLHSEFNQRKRKEA